MNNQEVSYPRLIAGNAYGWCVYRQARDRVHFDFGQTGLLLNLAEFKVLGAILEDACQPGVSRRNGLLAGTSSPTRAIFSCGHHQVAILIFDHAVFRFQRRDIDLLLELWDQAAGVFELNKHPGGRILRVRPDRFFGELGSNRGVPGRVLDFWPSSKSA